MQMLYYNNYIALYSTIVTLNALIVILLGGMSIKCYIAQGLFLMVFAQNT
jgi:hypothetical protein